MKSVPTGIALCSSFLLYSSPTYLIIPWLAEMNNSVPSDAKILEEDTWISLGHCLVDKFCRWDSYPNLNGVLRNYVEKSALVIFPENKMSWSVLFLPGCFPVPITSTRHHLWTSARAPDLKQTACQGKWARALVCSLSLLECWAPLKG